MNEQTLKKPSLKERWKLFSHTFFAQNFGAAVVGMAIGIGVGIFWTAPLFQWALPPAATPVFASAIGALIGAGSAMIFAQRTIFRSDREARRTVAMVIRTPTKTLEDMLDGIEASENQGVNTRIALTCLGVEVAKALERLDLLSPLHLQMRDGKGVAIADAQIALRGLKRITELALPDPDPDPDKQTIVVEENGRVWSYFLKSGLEASYNELFNVQLRLGHPIGGTVRGIYADKPHG